jgi:hypothetical protein
VQTASQSKGTDATVFGGIHAYMTVSGDGYLTPCSTCRSVFLVVWRENHFTGILNAQVFLATFLYD